MIINIVIFLAIVVIGITLFIKLSVATANALIKDWEQEEEKRRKKG
ncbi:MAG: hypothetical protein M0Z72_00515 [Deltaproteobacteria bacterium]|nr:hypothetical protein [Deltaproteobacteria bacterium]